MKVTTLRRQPDRLSREFGLFLHTLGYESTNQLSSNAYHRADLFFGGGGGAIAFGGNAKHRRKSIRRWANAWRGTLGASDPINLASDYPRDFKDEV